MLQALGGITEMERKCSYRCGLCVSASFLTSHPVSPNLTLLCGRRWGRKNSHGPADREIDGATGAAASRWVAQRRGRALPPCPGPGSPLVGVPVRAARATISWVGADAYAVASGRAGASPAVPAAPARRRR